MVLIPHEDLIAPMSAKYGPVYKSIIPKDVYTGVGYDAPVCGRQHHHLQRSHGRRPGLSITKVIFEHQPELAIHKEATNFTLENGASNKAVPSQGCQILQGRE
jgi:hypothetical protein